MQRYTTVRSLLAHRLPFHSAIHSAILSAIRLAIHSAFASCHRQYLRNSKEPSGMVELTKLAQRMKKNDGTVAVDEQSQGGKGVIVPSKKRKGVARQGERFESFASYGVGSDPEEEQDENKNNRNTIEQGKKWAKKGQIGGAPLSKKQKVTPAPNPMFLSFFKAVPLTLHEVSASGVDTKLVPGKPPGIATKEDIRTPFQIKSGMSRTTESSSMEDTFGSSAAVGRLDTNGAFKQHIIQQESSSTDTAPIPPKTLKKGKPEEKALISPRPKTKTPRTSKEKVPTRTEPESPQPTATRMPPRPRPDPTTMRPRIRRPQSDSEDENSKDPSELAQPVSTVTHRSVRDFFNVKPKEGPVKISYSPADQSVTLIACESVERPVAHDRVPAIPSIVAEVLDMAVDGSNEEASIVPQDKDKSLIETSPQKVTAVVRRRRLVQSCKLNPKRHTSPSESEEEVEPPPKDDSEEEKSVPEAEVQSDPETRASRGLMMSFLSTAKTAARRSDSNVLSKDAPLAPDNAFDTVSTTSELAPTTVVKKTCSKPKKKSMPVVRPSVRRKKPRSAFSDSDGSGSDTDRSLTDDMNDFMEPKVEEKPDPNQKSITSMFQKSSGSGAESLSKKAPKRILTSASRSLLSGGLMNFSNSCYLNSVLQALRTTEGCASVLFEIQGKIQALEESQGMPLGVTEYQRSLFDGALNVFRTLDMKECVTEETTSKRNLYPKEVIHTLRRGDSVFNTSDQQDAAEFLFYIISQFEDVLKALLQQGRVQSCETTPLFPENWQPIDDLFQVGTQTVTHCQKCPSISTKSDRGLDLTVQIDDENPSVIRDLCWGISETMKMEHMKEDNQRYCEKCVSKQDAHVYHSMTSLPKIMILRLQRYNFKEGAVKLQNGVSCSERMNFAQWMSRDYQGTHPEYELQAIIIHRGRVITSGHYYVYLRKDVCIETLIEEPSGESRIESKTYRWLKYNDSIVDPVSDQDMAKVFSGQVQAPSASDPVMGGTAASAADPLLKTIATEDKEATLNTLEDDIATPYVYIYKRVD